MRKHLLLLSWIFAIGILSSCKKERSGPSIDQAIVSQVISWLDKQKVASQPNKAANIEMLKNHLVFSRSWEENSNEGETIMVIPIDDAFRNAKKIDEQQIPALVLVIDKSSKIRRGNVVLYTPKDPTLKSIPRTAMHDVYTTAKPTASGQFRFLSVTGKWLYQLDYNNKRLASAGHIQPKVTSGSRTDGISAIVCIDWYLITTYYDDYGNVVYQTTEYVGTTCQECDNGMYQGFCPDGGGGGGSGQNENGYEYAVYKRWKWDLVTHVKSEEDVYGKKVQGEPYGGHFTSINHYTSYCHDCTPTNPSDKWTQFGGTANVIYPAQLLVRVRVAGNRQFEGVSMDFDITEEFDFGQIFP